MRTRLMALVLTTSAAATLAAQSGVTPKALGMIVYPAQKQAPEQQAKDESACVTWAESQTGIDLTQPGVDPNAAAQAAKDQASAATTGATVKGSAKGAAAGAAMGAITGDAGTGAALGAVAGAIGGRRAKKSAQHQAEAAGAQAAQQQNQAVVDQFKKAVGVCLQGRGYTVS